VCVETNNSRTFLCSSYYSLSWFCIYNCSKNASACILVSKNANFVLADSVSLNAHVTSSISHYGILLYTSLNSVKNLNLIIYSSFTESYQDDDDIEIHGIIRLASGQIRIITANFSKNVCYYQSSFCLVASDNSKVSDELQYCTEDSYVHHTSIINLKNHHLHK
jgi:hypothetical protein